MNAMQELAIKYPTLWEHIAKGGKVRGYDKGGKNISAAGDLTIIHFDSSYHFEMPDELCYTDIELLPLPKRVPTKDLGKAVNYFRRVNGWYYSGGSFYNRENDGVEHIRVCDVYEIVLERKPSPDWWPEELMEDEEI